MIDGIDGGVEPVIMLIVIIESNRYPTITRLKRGIGYRKLVLIDPCMLALVLLWLPEHPVN